MADKKDSKQFYTSYWKKFIKFAEPSAPDLISKHFLTLDRQYLGFQCDVPDAHFALNAPKTKKLRCELVLENTSTRELLLDILKCRKKLIAEDLKVEPEDLSFNYELKPRRACVHSEYFSIDNATLGEQYKWMLEMLKRFQGYFPKLMIDIYKILGLKFN